MIITLQGHPDWVGWTFQDDFGHKIAGGSVTPLRDSAWAEAFATGNQVRRNIQAEEDLHA
jgi:hypothetical protein